MNAAVIPIILEQHAEEAAFLWILRHHAVQAPHYRLKDLARLDGRVEAHIDGLRIAGPEGWRLCEQALGTGEAGEMFAAAVLALESRDRRRQEPVYAAVEQTPDALPGLLSALGWLAPQKLAGTVKEWLATDAPLKKRLGLTACAMHRVSPGPALDAVLADHQAPPELLATALRAAGQVKRRDLLYAVRRHLQAEDEAVRFWSAWSAALLGDRQDAVESLKTLLVTGTRFRDRALQIVLRAMDGAGAVNFLKGMAQYPEWQRDLVVGAGILGDPAYIPWLIKQMENPELARVAGEAFGMITGADLAYEDLDGERPEGFEAGPTEDPKDDDVAMDRDEDLPWPEPNKVHAWWQAQSARFPAGHRYRMGAPGTEAHLQKVLREAYQRQRAAAALELALMKPDMPLFEVRAPGWRQQAELLQTKNPA